MQATGTPRQGLLLKEGLCTLIALALIAGAAALYPLAPVGQESGPQASAPWIFVGFQQLLRWLPVRVGGLLLPGLGLLFLAVLPWLRGGQGAAVPAYVRPGWLELIAWFMLLAWAGLTAWGMWGA